MELVFTLIGIILFLGLIVFGIFRGIAAFVGGFAVGATKPEERKAMGEAALKACTFVTEHIVGVGFVIMVIFTLIAIAIPISMPLLAFFWYRFYRQAKLFKEKEERRAQPSRS